MKVLIICASVLVVLLVIWKIVKNAKKSRSHTNKKATGCGSRLSCQHMDLGKASKAGKDKGTTFCKYYNDFVRRQDNCPNFYPHGCANGLCDYSNHAKGAIYCKYYQTNVQPKGSCPNYLDFFDTEAGKALAESLK